MIAAFQTPANPRVNTLGLAGNWSLIIRILASDLAASVFWEQLIIISIIISVVHVLEIQGFQV